ncbi:MAG: hypothetical protein EHM34_07260 [Nitrosopumilales archaeon]|nr:MAG: hypothetical protein EHM34_07260 [Nitrosopumilales archaeon]
MFKKYILGGGISALVYQFYNRDYTIISPEIGGQLKMQFQPPKILHKNKFTEKLLTDLNLPLDSSTIKMRYLKDKKLLDSISVQDKQSFINKKMSEYDTKFSNVIFSDTKLSVEENYIDYFTVPMTKVLEKLTEESSDIINAKVILHNSNNKMLGLHDYSTLQYSHIVSTIPANDYQHITYTGEKKNLKYLPVTYVYADCLLNGIDMSNCDWVYICDRDIPFNRISKLGDYFVYECTGVIEQDKCENYFGEETCVDTTIQRLGVIFTNEFVDTESVTFLGRLAQYKHDVKLQDVINKSIRGGE